MVKPKIKDWCIDFKTFCELMLMHVACVPKYVDQHVYKDLST